MRRPGHLSRFPSGRCHRFPEIGATYQPGEVPLQMTVAQLTAVRDAAASVASRPGVHTFDDFIIFNGPCTSALPKMFARALAGRLRLSLTARTGNEARQVETWR
jgi:hypothetical protein